MNFIKAFFLASRPKTLIAGLCPVLIGTSFSYYFLGKIEVYYFSLILAATIMIQVATNFFNDALDGESGRDTKDRKGPKRMASSGEVTPKALKASALVLLALSFFIGIILFLKSGWLVFAVGIPALFLAYLYTGTKFSLSANGIADIFVILYFGVIPAWVTCFVLSGVQSVEVAFAGLQCGFLCNALLLVNNLRDESEDKKTKKNTLVVKFGRKFGLSFLSMCLFLPYVLNLSLFGGLFFRAGLWSFSVLFIAVYLFVKVCLTPPSPRYNKYLGLTALHLILFTVFYCLGILSS